MKRIFEAVYCSMLRSFPELVVGLGGRLDLVEVIVHPARERRHLAGAGEAEAGSPLHRVVEDGRLHAADLPQQLHAAVVARDQRPLRGRHRNVELALGVLAVDEQGPRETDRHLCDAEEVLDVAGQDPRVEGVASDVLERRARDLLGEPQARLLRGARVVVVGVAGYSSFLVAHLHLPGRVEGDPRRRSAPAPAPNVDFAPV
ncbi:MAG: hypothetical protein R2700_00025 [Solirubrobacterales bacterium]